MENFIIKYAPNTEYICLLEGYVIKNVDGSGVDYHLKNEGFTEAAKDKKIREKIIAILN